MAIITVSRGTFSGGKALAECLSRRLNYRCIDRDMLVRKAATPRVSDLQLRAALELPPASPEDSITPGISIWLSSRLL